MADGSGPAWNDVEQRFAAWGKHVSQRYHDAARDKDEGTDAETQRKLEAAAREVVDELGRAFGAVGDTLKDDEAKRDLREAVSALGVAIGATLSEAGDAIRRQVRTGDTKPTDEEPPRPDAPASE